MTTPIQIGQRWRTRGGFVAHIHANNDGRDLPASLYPFVVRAYPMGTDERPHYFSVTRAGKHIEAGALTSAFDLAELLEDVPVATCGPCDCPDCKPTPSLDALAGIGDVNSTARGSGARYNTGKVPYELIPLRILAVSIGTFQGGMAERASNALMKLGEFQERDLSGGGVLAHPLYDIFEILGFDGWAECARVFDYGRRKYAEWNWAKGMAWSVPLACAARHLLAMIRGEEIDPESGLSHRGHVFCNVVMLLVYGRTFAEGDDRPAAGMLRLAEAA